MLDRRPQWPDQGGVPEANGRIRRKGGESAAAGIDRERLDPLLLKRDGRPERFAGHDVAAGQAALPVDYEERVIVCRHVNESHLVVALEVTTQVLAAPGIP